MNAMLAILGLSAPELIVVVLVILVLFGAKRIPEFAKGLGKGINEFKKASRDVVDSMDNEASAPPAPKPAPPANTTAQSPSTSTPTKSV